MVPKRRGFSGQMDLFQRRTDDVAHENHPLVILSKHINWKVFDKSFDARFHPVQGRPGLSTRLMVGLHYLKHTYNLSDEALLSFYLESPQWQYFCGQEYYRNVLPCDRSSLTRWRKRIGEKKMSLLLKETIDTARRLKFLKISEMRSIVCDATVQEKAIAFPTDSRLSFKALNALVRFCKKSGVKLRQTYKRKSKISLFLQARFSHLRRLKKAKREEKNLRLYLGRVIRDVKRKVPSWKCDKALRSLLEISTKIQEQKRCDKDKIYSVHAPEVKCYSKGKAHKKYEFGSKVSVAVSSRNCWVLGVLSFTKSVHDVLTFTPALEQVRELTGVALKRVFVDKGYRGKLHHPKDVEVCVSGQKHKNLYRQRLSRRRSCVEPVIGHLKFDGRMGRNFLLGADGDAVNAVLSGAGQNMRKLMNKTYQLPSFFVSFLKSLLLRLSFAVSK